MKKLVTNELSLGLDQKLRDDLIDNFDKIQDGVDGQSDAVNKQIKDMLGDVPLQDQNEVTQARIDANGKQYQTIKTRMDIDQATAETALSEGRDTSTEVKSARVGGTGTVYPTLKQRIDNQEVTMAKNINDKLSEISTVPETFKDLATLKSAYPNGKNGLFVTVDNGHKYIWQNNQWQDSGIYQSVGIAKGAVNYDNLDNQAKNLGSTLFDIRQSALNKGYYQYLPFVFEFGSLDSSNGNERDDTQKMVRSGFVRGDGEIWNFFDSLPDLYNYRLLSYKLDGTFNKLEFDWKSSDGSTMVSDASLMYRLTLTTKDQSNTVLAEANQAVTVSSDKDKAPYNPMKLGGKFGYMINIGGGRKPEISFSNQTVKIIMPEFDLFYFDNTQTGFALQSPENYRKQVFTLENNQTLYWDLDTNKILVGGVYQERPDNNVLLANNIFGQITNGYFAQFMIDWGKFGHTLYAGGSSKPTFIFSGVSGTIMTIKLPDTNLFYRDDTQTGFQLTSPDSYKNQEFTLLTNQMLVWDLKNNKIIIQKDNEKRPDQSALLANNLYGRVTGGDFYKYYQSQNYDGYTFAKGHEVTAIEHHKALTSGSIGNTQSLCFIGDNLLACHGAKSDHTQLSSLILYDENFNQLKEIKQNIGHFNTVDYNEKYDTLITSNASDDVEDGKIYLIKDFSKLKDGDSIGVASDNVTTVYLYYNGQSAFNGNIGICFGETDYIAYVSFVNTNTVKNIGQMGTIGFAKIMLGIGENDLSKADTGWGNFKSGSTGYNGTVKILEKYYGENIGVNQDMTYFDGHLWGTFGRYDSEFYKIALHSGGKFTLEESYMLPNYNETTGAFNQLESEGAAIWKGNYYLLTYKGAINAVPINGKQLGNGEVGAKVAFDFPTSQTPHVTITPTSATTDLYIDAIDTTGFTVKSASDKAGSFNWESSL